MLKHKTSVRRALCLESFLKHTLEFPSLVVVGLCGKHEITRSGVTWVQHLRGCGGVGETGLSKGFIVP